MTEAEVFKAAEEARKEGYLVVVFTPEELAGANPDKVEDRLIELGWEVIEATKYD